MKPTISALAALILMGCAPQKTLTIYTNPSGATLYEAGGQTYISPATVYYNIANVDQAYIDAGGCLLVQPFTAVWSSGARVDAEGPLRLCGAQSEFAITIQRPAGPGLDQDLAMARLLIEREIQRLEGQAALGEGLEKLGEGMGCQIAGGCSSGRQRYPDEIRTTCHEDGFGNTRCRSRTW